MSRQLLDFASEFSAGKLTACEFSDRYIDQWKEERDNGIGIGDPPKVSECLSTIFCLADLFNPGEDRDDHELDEVQLRRKVREAITELCPGDEHL